MGWARHLACMKQMWSACKIFWQLQDKKSLERHGRRYENNIKIVLEKCDVMCEHNWNDSGSGPVANFCGNVGSSVESYWYFSVITTEECSQFLRHNVMHCCCLNGILLEYALRLFWHTMCLVAACIHCYKPGTLESSWRWVERVDLTECWERLGGGFMQFIFPRLCMRSYAVTAAISIPKVSGSAPVSQAYQLELPYL